MNPKTSTAVHMKSFPSTSGGFPKVSHLSDRPFSIFSSSWRPSPALKCCEIYSKLSDIVLKGYTLSYGIQDTGSHTLYGNYNPMVLLRISGNIIIYCDVPGSPCLSKKRVKCTVHFFLKSLTPCLVAAGSPGWVCWRPHLAGTRQYDMDVTYRKISL